MKTYKALMVLPTTHKKVVVQAKQKEITVDEFINNLIVKNKKNVYNKKKA